MSDENKTRGGMEPEGAMKFRPFHEPDTEGTEGHSVRKRQYDGAPPAQEIEEPGPDEAVKIRP